VALKDTTRNRPELAAVPADDTNSQRFVYCRVKLHSECVRVAWQKRLPLLLVLLKKYLRKRVVREQAVVQVERFRVEALLH
jgi:hypothetical protein